MQNPFDVTETTALKIARKREESEPLVMVEAWLQNHASKMDAGFQERGEMLPVRRILDHASHHVPKARLYRQRQPNPQIGEKRYCHPFLLCAFRDNQIGNGANQSEVSGKRGTHRHESPRSAWIRQAHNEGFQDQDRRHVTDEI